MDSPALTECPKIVKRIARRKHPLQFSRIDPIAAEGRGGNRYDVPGGGVLYASTQEEGCFAETLARFRPAPRWSGLSHNGDNHLMNVGAVPADWRIRRVVVNISLDDPLPFVDVESLATRTWLTNELATDLISMGINHPLDVDDVRGKNRRLTRLIAHHIYTRTDIDDETPLYSGIRYVSRVGNHECWAIFDGVDIEDSELFSIEKENSALQTFAQEAGLIIH